MPFYREKVSPPLNVHSLFRKTRENNDPQTWGGGEVAICKRGVDTPSNILTLFIYLFIYLLIKHIHTACLQMAVQETTVVFLGLWLFVTRTYLSTFENFPGVESARQLVSDILPIARGRYK